MTKLFELLAGLIVLCVIIAAVSMMPEFMRYVKIRRM